MKTMGIDGGSARAELRALGGWLSGLLATAAFPFLLASCAERTVAEPNAAPPAATAPAASAPVDREDILDDVVDNPSRYYGQVVTVRGEIDDVLGPGAFTLEREGLFDDNEILVIATRVPGFVAGKTNPDWVRDRHAQVTGTVRAFVRAEIERDYDLTFDNDVWVELERRPVLIAQSMQMLPDR